MKKCFAFLATALLSSIAYAAPAPIVSTDGQSQVALPEGWSKTTGLNDKAEIEVKSPAKGLYMIVMTEGKADFVKMDLPTFSQTTSKSIVQGLTEVEVSKPVPVEINGMKGIQLTIFGNMDNLRIGYVHTSLESAKNYYQILEWGPRTAFDREKGELTTALNGFTELATK